MASNSIKSGFKRSALTVALGLCFAGTVHAQATTGTVFGNAAPGETITVVSDTGFARTVAVDSSGRYSIGSLPVGSYTVTAKKGDQVVGTKQILVKVSSGTEASFAGASSGSGNELGTITVTATGAGIDVTQVDSRTVITAKDLAVLPIAHSAEAIAMLAPGAVQGSSRFGASTVSFGGAGITENTYYINGFNVTDMWKSIGGVGLPYGSIAQQETFTGGYDAMYGRSDGGVINQVGKRGSNDWHFGGQIRVIPKSLVSGGKDYNYPGKLGQIGQVAGVYTPTDPNYIPRDSTYSASGNGCGATGTAGTYCYHYPASQAAYPGTLYQRKKDDKSWSNTYSAYVGGPLVPNKLFFFLSAEETKGSSISTSIRNTGTPTRLEADNSSKKLYAKLDWNINDSNILELTGIKQNDHGSGDLYRYSYATMSEGAFFQKAAPTKTNTRIEIAKYTNYLTDNLNFSVMYGKNVVNNPTLTAVSSALPFISGQSLIAPSALPAAAGGSYQNLILPQLSASGANTTARLQGTGVRFDVEYKVGSHQIRGGIDNMKVDAFNQGGAGPSGPGYSWTYQPDGTTVYKTFFDVRTTASLVEKAQYIQDNWQVTDRFLLKLGIRNDEFNNKNASGQSYVHQKHQLAPRLGFAWDLKGDSTMKLFGNLGRYYLALPSGMAQRFSSAAINYSVPNSYTKVDINGVPLDPTVIGAPISANHEFGQAVDPNSIVAKGLKSQYQDEAILGMDWQFSKKWIAGAKVTYRKIGRIIDDWCDTSKINAGLRAAGYDDTKYDVPGCLVINPAQSNTFAVAKSDGSGYTDVTLSAAQMGFTSATAAKPIRKYQALDLYVEHPFDGKWQARVDYTLSRNPGNTEGQVKSNLGQQDISKTQDWDAAALMYNSYGYMANDRRHVLRARGLYQFAPEWLVTGKVLVMSGAPFDCLGYYYNENDPIQYGASYHTCFNKPSAPGATRGPWTKQLDLGIVYRPRYFDKKLTVALDVFNVTNDQKATQYQSRLETGQICAPDFSVCHGSGTVRTDYKLPLSFQQPRYFSLSVSYDY